MDCIVITQTFAPPEIEMLVDDPKDYEELHEMALDQELCIHITEDMLTMSPDQSNGYSGTDNPKGEVWFFCTLSLRIRIFKIIYDALQHNYDEVQS